MKSAQSYLVLLLALTTAGGAAYIWKQYQELVDLRASAFSQDDRADLQKRLWNAEKRAKALAAELAAAKNHPSANATEDATAAASAGTPAAGGPDRSLRRAGGGPRLNNVMAMMDQPEMQKLMAIQGRAMLDSRFAPLFKNLNLTPEQLDKFKNLLVEKQMALVDVLAASRAEGLTPRDNPEEFRKMVADTQAELDNNIKATLGDAGFAQYQQYQQTLPQRGVVNQLQQSLSYTSTPLTDAQTEQMVQLLAQAAPQRAANSTTPTRNMAFTMGGPMGYMGGGSGSTITPEAINLAQGVLSPPQLQALQQLQQQQQAQQQLQQAMRQSMGNRGGNNAGPGGTVPTAPKPVPKG